MSSHHRVTLFLLAIVLIDDREAAGHGERGHVQDRGAGEAADAKEQGARFHQGQNPALTFTFVL